MSVRPASSTVSARQETRLARHISATWWYTASGVLLGQVPLVLFWVLTLLRTGSAVQTVAVVGIGGMVWIATSAPLVLNYRHRDGAALRIRRRGLLLPLTIGLAYGVTVWLVSGIWIIAAAPVLQNLVLLHWPRGVRLRVVVAATLLLVALWIVDTQRAVLQLTELDATVWWLLGLFTIATPPMTVLSLWWWDVLVTLNRARTAEARLGATQERLRVATDVHDLQGHHLQVIALQLELTERLMPHDPAAALEPLQSARASVDAARQETRDLATKFRSVPLRDEIANAVDLLRAAGTTAEASLTEGTEQAPADVLGPVIRETTTNVLRHGSGAWARLTLTREGEAWRYEIANDRIEGPESPAGSGLEGIRHRVGEADGSIEVCRGRSDFTVVVTVPAGGAS